MSVSTYRRPIERSKRWTGRPVPVQSLSLLAQLQPSLITEASVGAWFRQARVLEIRANVLLVFREPAYEDLSNAVHVITVTNGTRPEVVRSLGVRVCKHTFRFREIRQKNAFWVAILTLIDFPGPISYNGIAGIGSGASGKVHIASRYAGDDELVAVKTIQKAFVFNSPLQLKNLITERLTLARAAESTSPFTVRLLDAFETPSHFNFVFDLAAYGDLHSFLNHMPNRRIPECAVRHLFVELVLAVLDIHSMGLLYRDIKASNILLTRNGHIRLADFGLVKQVRVSRNRCPVSDNGITISPAQPVGRSSSFVGTRRYMAPEQLLTEGNRRASYGAKADIWSMGILLYIMLAGRHPFTLSQSPSEDNRAELTWAIANAEISIPSFISSDAALLLQCMLHRIEEKRIRLESLALHPWFANLDFNDVRHRAARDVPVKEVLDLVVKLKINSIPEAVEMDGASKSEYFFEFKREDLERDSENSQNSLCDQRLAQLPGFDYFHR